MKTRAECLLNAAVCEQMAADADRGGRTMLLETAAHWRTLAAHAAADPLPRSSGTPYSRATLNGASRPVEKASEVSMSKQPPVPPANRSAKGTGSDPTAKEPQVKPTKPPQNLREQGDAGNIDQNTRNQGYQQDR